MKILITGGAGFLGGECIRQLRDAGHDVVTTDRHGDVDLTGDLSDEQFCRTLPEVDAVVHSAAVQYVSADLPWFARHTCFERNNVQATRHMVERYSGRNTHFIFVGTSMMYQQCGMVRYGPASRMQAQGVYSTSKLAAYELVRAMPNPTATLVPCIIAGSGRGGLFRPFAESIIKFGGVAIPGGGDHPVHLVHVQDAARLIAGIVDRRATGIFNAAGPQPLSIRQWVDEMAGELGVARVWKIRLPLAPIHFLCRMLGYRFLAGEQLLMLKHAHVLDTESSLALGWQPQWDNASIIRETVKALRATKAQLVSAIE
jgi:nucleoside-diphosphate-sugar epimerase